MNSSVNKASFTYLPLDPQRFLPLTDDTNDQALCMVTSIYFSYQYAELKPTSYRALSSSLCGWQCVLESKHETENIKEDSNSLASDLSQAQNLATVYAGGTILQPVTAGCSFQNYRYGNYWIKIHLLQLMLSCCYMVCQCTNLRII